MSGGFEYRRREEGNWIETLLPIERNFPRRFPCPFDFFFFDENVLLTVLIIIQSPSNTCSGIFMYFQKHAGMFINRKLKRSDVKETTFYTIFVSKSLKMTPSLFTSSWVDQAGASRAANLAFLILFLKTNILKNFFS